MRRKWAVITTIISMLVFFLALTIPPSFAMTSSDIEALQKKIDAMAKELQELKKQLAEQKKEMEEQKKATKKAEEERDELSERVDKTEMHVFTDKVSLGLNIRARADSIHYDNLQIAPNSFVSGFFTQYNAANPSAGGFNGAPLSFIKGSIKQMKAMGMVPDPDSYDYDNDIIYTTRVRMRMRARYGNHLSADGRLAMYKVWGDSTGVRWYNGNINSVVMDGNTASIPSDDTLRVERAYFTYRDNAHPLKWYFSFGRRPATDGPPLQYRNNTLEGGSPLAHIINWQFDGATLFFGLEDILGWPGPYVKFCYGVGYEGGWGNATTLQSNGNVDDVHMLGTIVSLYDDDLTKVSLNYAHAFDVTDGFTGLTVMPFYVSKNSDGTYNFTQNTGGFVSRVGASANIGDADLLTVLVQSQFHGIDWFVSGAWSHTEPDNVSKNPFFGDILGLGLLSSDGDLESHDGYSFYAGFRVPIDKIHGKFGFEYNYGSKYWFNFTGAEDSLVGSKLAVRGHVFEPYYIQEILGRHFYLIAGAQFYDYEYTNSGNPLGKPVDIDDATALDALTPLVDDVQVYYLSATVEF